MAKVQPTAWAGWVYFAGVMMLLIGSVQFMAGLVALFKDSYYLLGESGLLVFDYTAWGWIHLILGVLIFLAGTAVLAGQVWGRVVGVFLAGLSALTYLAFLSAYPVWSITVIALDVLVIYALTLHGNEVK